MDGPHFLVIGGMKCGSTSLYDDLASQPAICLAEKELNVLSDPKFSPAAAKSTYRRSFAKATAGKLCGDVSTTYAKLPDLPFVAERAAELMGDQLKIIYVVREPVARCISHHHHMHSWRGDGHMPASIDDCIRKHPSLIQYSRYAMQLEPWRTLFGDAAIHVILFEEFVGNRRQALCDLGQFLGLELEVDRVDPFSVSNRSKNKPVLNEFWHGVHQNRLYQSTLRRIMPRNLRTELRKFILPKAPPRPAPPSAATVELILERTNQDERELRSFLGRTKPLWDHDAVRRKYSCVPKATA